MPDPSVTELMQAERLAACFKAEIRGGEAALEDFRAIRDTAIPTSRVLRAELSAADIDTIRARLAALPADWISPPPGGALGCDGM